jgi:hypothetical protein
MQAYTMMELVNRTMLGDETFYDRAEADSRFEQLEKALDSCLIVLGLELLERGKFQTTATEAIEEGKKALALRPST